MYYQPLTTPYIVQQTNACKIGPIDVIENQRKGSLNSLKNQIYYQNKPHKMNTTYSNSLNNSFQQYTKNDSLENANRSMILMDNINDKQPQIFYKKKSQNKENRLSATNIFEKQINKTHSNEYIINQQQEEITLLRNKVLTQQEKIKTLKQLNLHTCEELKKVEFQRDTFHSQILNFQEQFRREQFNFSQQIQQFILDRQLQDNSKKQLIQELETLRVSNVIKQATELLPQDQDQIYFQGQLNELEQQNYDLRQQVRDLKEEISVVQLKNQEENYLVGRERQNLKNEQEKLLRLSDELLLEASSLKKTELDQQDPQNQMLNQWRTFLIEQFSHEFQLQKQELIKQVQQTPRNQKIDNQYSETDMSSRLYYTKQAYKKLNRLAMSSAGMLSFKMNYKKEFNAEKLEEIKQQIKKLRI